MNTLEDEVIFFGDKLNDIVYEKFNSGEINLVQLKEMYSNLSEWSNNTEKLLKSLNENGLNTF